MMYYIYCASLGIIGGLISYAMLGKMTTQKVANNAVWLLIGILAARLAS